MTHAQSLAANIKAIHALADQMKDVNPEDISRELSNDIKDGLQQMQTHLQMAFPELRKVRKELFYLAPGESPVN